MAQVTLLLGYNLSEISLGIVNMVAYNSALIIWLGYALRNPDRAASEASLLGRWEGPAVGIRRPLTPDSAIPAFNGTVELDLSRAPAAQSSAVYRELSLLESELNENIKALKFTSAQISRRLGRLNILAKNPRSQKENSGDA